MSSTVTMMMSVAIIFATLLFSSYNPKTVNLFPSSSIKTDCDRRIIARVCVYSRRPTGEQNTNYNEWPTDTPRLTGSLIFPPQHEETSDYYYTATTILRCCTTFASDDGVTVLDHRNQPPQNANIIN